MFVRESRPHGPGALQSSFEREARSLSCSTSRTRARAGRVRCEQTCDVLLDPLLTTYGPTVAPIWPL